MANDERKTPLSFFKPLDDFFRFTLDPCTTADNPLGMMRFFTKEQDGLAQSWKGERVFVNPPYSKGNMFPWTNKCIAEAMYGEAFVVLLCQCDCSTKWWRYANREAWFRWDIPYRIKFDGMDAGAKFASNLFLFGGPLGRWSMKPGD